MKSEFEKEVEDLEKFFGPMEPYPLADFARVFVVTPEQMKQLRKNER